MLMLLIRLFNSRCGMVFCMSVMVSFGIFLRWHFDNIGWTLGWKTSQYFFSYQDLGFVNRGLVASLLYPFPVLLSKESLLTVTLAIIISFIVVWLRFFEKITINMQPRDRAVIALVFILSPSTLMHLGLDYGRFDPLNIVLTILAAACLRR